MNHHEHFCLTKKSTEKAKHCKEEEKENVLSLAPSCWIQRWATSMCFFRAMDSILAIEDSFVHFVGKVDNILPEFYSCDSLKQSIKLSFCGTSWDVILFPWFPIDQPITKENTGSRSAFLFLHRNGNHCQWRPAVLSFLQLWALASLSLALLAQSLGKERSLGYFEIVDYCSSQCPVSSSWIWKELTQNMKYLSWRNRWGSNFSSSDSRNFLGDSFVKRESTCNFFNILSLREWNPILQKLHTDTQYVFGLSELFGLEFSLQQISKPLIDLLCFWHNQDVINIDEKQNFIFNQQSWFFQADFEFNGYQEIWKSKVPFSSLLFEDIDALLK